MPLTVSMPSRIAVPVALGGQQATVAARTATLEQLRDRLEAGEPPEKKVTRMTEEEQRLVQQALQRNLFSMARQIPMKIKINGKGEAQTLRKRQGGKGSRAWNVTHTAGSPLVPHLWSPTGQRARHRGVRVQGCVGFSCWVYYPADPNPAQIQKDLCHAPKALSWSSLAWLGRRGRAVLVPEMEKQRETEMEKQRNS